MQMNRVRKRIASNLELVRSSESSVTGLLTRQFATHAGWSASQSVVEPKVTELWLLQGDCNSATEIS